MNPAATRAPSRGDAVLNRRAAPPADALIRDAHVLDPRTGLDERRDVLVRDGTIAELATPGALATPADGEVIDGEGLHAFPAFVDPHVHLRTPGREDEEDVDSGTRAAAAGGFCKVVAMPNTDPVVDSAPVLRSLRDRAHAEARVACGFLAAVTRGQAGRDLTEMAELSDAGALGFTDDGLPVADAGVLRQALQYQRLCGGVVCLHAEEPSLSAGGVMHEGPVSTLLGLAGIPSLAESTMIARDAAIAAYEDARIHVQHLSAAESVVAVQRAKEEGVAVTAEVTPHHLTLTDESVRELDTAYKMNPPLRSAADRDALIDALRSGAIDCVATDHAPHSREEKEQPFELAPMGVTGLETAFAALHTDLVLPGRLSLALLVERMSAGAAVLDLAVPRIEPDAPADVCLVDLAADWLVGEAGYESRSTNSSFAGRTLTGRVRMTFAGGAVAYRERSFAIEAV